MLITNDITPFQLILELCSPSCIAKDDAAQFFTGDQSSHDWLVDAFEHKINIVLNYFRRSGSSIVPTQHPRDNGVDLRFDTLDEDGRKFRIGIQIKSNREADANKKKKALGQETMAATLKRQAFEAQREKLNEWWVISCFNPNVHGKLLQAIHAEVSVDIDQALKIRHIGPRGAAAFLCRSDAEISALCLLFLSDQDAVLHAAKNEWLNLSYDSQEIVDHFFWGALENGSDYKFSSSEIRYLDDSLDIAGALHSLEESRVLIPSSGGEFYSVDVTTFPALCALFFEGRVRHNHSPEGAIDFARALLFASKPVPESEF